MRERPWWLWLLMLCCLGIVKAHIHMLRLLILIAVGLGGLYMMHLLAQDFQQFNNSFKPGQGGLLSTFGSLSNRGKRAIPEMPKIPNWVVERLVNETKGMRQLLKNDPIGCARKYVCHIQTKTKLTKTQDSVLYLLRAFRWLDVNGEWKKAEELGKKRGRVGACEEFYKKCWYSGAQLDKFMSVF